MAGRRAVASGEEENQDEENRMRDIHIGERGAETANEERPDKLRRTVRFEQEAPNTSTSSSSTTRVPLEYPTSGERQILADHVFMLMTTYSWMYCVRWIDERVVTSKKCWYRKEDTRDLKISELNELVQSITRLKALEKKI